jgi:prepilin-type N-terminal cleavage/methylation domain-containing protein
MIRGKNLIILPYLSSIVSVTRLKPPLFSTFTTVLMLATITTMNRVIDRIRGFTLIELIVVIAIIGILATISIVGFSRYQGDTRDARRASSASVIAEALEKYYDLNGEYPSCAALTSGTVTQDTLKGIDSGTIVAPQAASGTTNSIKCTSAGNVLAVTGTDFFEYQGDGSPECSGAGSCLSFTLKYRDETDGLIKTITSRRTTSIATSGTSTITATATGTSSINLSWTAVSNSTSYTVQRSLDSGFTSGLAAFPTSNTTLTDTGLAAGTTYYYSVTVYNNGMAGSTSKTASATTTVTPPATPTIAAAMSGSSAQGTSSGVACASGTTTNYSFQYYATTVSTPGAWSGWSTQSTALVYSVTNAAQGNQYGFHVAAYCVGPNATSPASGTSATATVVVPISTPAAPTYAGPGSFVSGTGYIVNYGTSCPAGTSVSNGNFTSQSWSGSYFGPHPFGFNDWWTLGPAGGANVNYWGTYQCTDFYTTSPTSAQSGNTINVHT